MDICEYNIVIFSNINIRSGNLAKNCMLQAKVLPKIAKRNHALRKSLTTKTPKATVAWTTQRKTKPVESMHFIWRKMARQQKLPLTISLWKQTSIIETFPINLRNLFEGLQRGQALFLVQQ